MKGKLLAGVSEYRALTLILFLAFILCVLVLRAVPVNSQTNSPPTFPAAAYLLHSPESPAPFRPVGVPVVATDPDRTDKLTYSLEGEDSTYFSIVESSGRLEAIKPLDYETKSTYLVRVKATDTGGRFDTATVTVEVTNIDEAGVVTLAPIITNMGPGAHATLTDPDNNLSNVSWQWATSYDQVTWRDIVGAESPSFVPRDEDLRQFLRVRVTYSDGHGAGKMATTLFRGDLLPGGNHPPEFPFSESGVRSVAASTPLGGKIGTPLLAGDLDQDSLSYWISGDAFLFFEIEPQSGQLRAKSALDSNFTGRYFGKVHVFDGRGGSATKEIRIDVGDIPATPHRTEQEAKAEEAPGDDPDVASVTGQYAQPQSQPTSQESRPGFDTVPEPTAVLIRSAKRDSTELGTLGTQGADRSSASVRPNREEKEQASPPPVPSVESAAASAVVPTSGIKPNATAEGSTFSELLKWATWSSIGALVIAGVLLLLWRLRRFNRRPVRIPPPSFGPERRFLP